MVRAAAWQVETAETCVIPVPQHGSRPHRPPHPGPGGRRPTLTSLWAAAWPRGGWRPRREGPAGTVTGSSDPRSLPSCAAAPTPRPPASRPQRGRTRPCRGRTVRTLRAPPRPGGRRPPLPGGRGWERWTAGSATSSWWTRRPAASEARASCLSRETHRTEASGLVLPEALVVSEGVGPCQEALNTVP